MSSLRLENTGTLKVYVTNKIEPSIIWVTFGVDSHIHKGSAINYLLSLRWESSVGLPRYFALYFIDIVKYPLHKPLLYMSSRV